MVIELKLYNTLSKQVEVFTPLEANRVKLYVCGPTVYDDAHLGHARCYMTWDVLFRLLSLVGYQVTYVRNITDVEDKILNKAKAQGTEPQVVAEHYTQLFHEVMKQLNILPPTKEPKATQYVDVMTWMVGTLKEKEFAYQVADGTVYFNTSKLKHYGQLKAQNLEDMEAGSRVDVDQQKQNPSDFALWKPAPEGEPMVWKTPWGSGRPGWHLECSAMIRRELGEQIDIHCGGMDLVFPHHENEIAQSEAFTGKSPFVKYWLHNGFVNVSGDKMSKSLGNFETISNLLKSYNANTLRYFVLTHHYRTPVDFNTTALEGPKNRIHKMSKDLQQLIQTHQLDTEYLLKKGQSLVQAHIQSPVKPSSKKPETPEACITAWLYSMCDDMNTASALAHWNALYDLIFESDSGVHETALAIFLALSQAMGFCWTLEAATKSLGDLSEALLNLLIEVRHQAREEKNWAMSDHIRDRLKALGIELKDHKDAPASWALLMP